MALTPQPRRIYQRTQITTPAANPAITLETAKSFLRVTTDTDNILITAMIAAATQRVENYLNRKIITQTLTGWQDAYPGTSDLWWSGTVQAARSVIHGQSEIELQWLPVQSVTSVTSHLSDGSSAIFDAANYIIDTVSDNLLSRLVLKEGRSWPTTNLARANGVEVIYIAGCADDEAALLATCPLIYQGLLMEVAFLYENRGDCASCSGSCVTDCAIRAMLDTLKVHKV